LVLSPLSGAATSARRESLSAAAAAAAETGAVTGGVVERESVPRSLGANVESEQVERGGEGTATQLGERAVVARRVEQLGTARTARGGSLARVGLL
jgi:hypothetical protein